MSKATSMFNCTKKFWQYIIRLCTKTQHAEDKYTQKVRKIKDSDQESRVLTNIMLFVFVNVQKRTVLIITLLNLLGESLGELQMMVVEIKNLIFLDTMQLMNMVMPVIMTLKSLEVISETTFKRKIAEVLLIKELRPTLNIQEKLVELELFNQFPQYSCF